MYLNNNKIENQKNLKDNKYIYIKIVSPNFELKYNLSEKEISDRIKKLIKYSDVEKNKKTLFCMARREHYLENIFLK